MSFLGIITIYRLLTISAVTLTTQTCGRPFYVFGNVFRRLHVPWNLALFMLGAFSFTNTVANHSDMPGPRYSSRLLDNRGFAWDMIEDGGRTKMALIGTIK